MANFKALIIGAGPNGLLTALTLQRAGIDYVILEKRDEADLNWGASVCIWPHSLRILDQLGLLEEAEKLYLPIQKKCNLRRDGSVISWSNMLGEVNTYHGYPWMLFQRGVLVDLLKRHISEPESHILLNKQVTAINSEADKVEVTCADGTSHRGSILIGADGIHSTARTFIDEASTKSTKDKDSYLEGTFMTTYYGVYGHGESLSAELTYQAVYETHSEGFSTQLIVPSPNRYFFLIYKKLDKPTRQRQWVTPEQAEELAKVNAETYLAPGIKYKEVWESRKWTHMASLEEGVTKTWFKDRVTLVGDAAMKMTPNLGFGINNGWQSTVALTNLLRTLLADKPNPDAADLTKLFEKYQGFRHGNTRKDVDLSALVTRVEAWDNWLWKVSDQYIVPYVGGDIALLRFFCCPRVKNGIVLDFLPEPNFREGKVKWDNKPLKVVRLEETWRRQREFGHGGFGSVWLESCVDGDGAGKLRAVKEMRKSLFPEVERFYRELEALTKFSHDNYVHCFVRCYGWYESENMVFIAMEYLECGDLQGFLDRPFTEAETQIIASQLVEGLGFMHDNGFTHRDLKPKNILVRQPGPDWWIKIADFGISKRAEQNNTALRTFIGSAGYFAPEVLGYFSVKDASSDSLSYTSAIDVWALGEILFRLITESPVFKTSHDLFNHVVHGLPFPTGELLTMDASEDCCDFIYMLMRANPSDRLTIREAATHPWMKNVLEEPDVNSTVVEDWASPATLRPELTQSLDHTAEWSTIQPLGSNVSDSCGIQQSNTTVRPVPQDNRSTNQLQDEPLQPGTDYPLAQGIAAIVSGFDNLSVESLNQVIPNVEPLGSPPTPEPPRLPVMEAGTGYLENDSSPSENVPSIRFEPYCEPDDEEPVFYFPPIFRSAPTGNEIIRVGRYQTDLDDNPNNPDPAAHVGFKSKVVSRRHCEFWHDRGKWYMRDTGSSSGTFLNDVRLSPRGEESRAFQVSDGDIVDLGVDIKNNDDPIFRSVAIELKLN